MNAKTVITVLIGSVAYKYLSLTYFLILTALYLVSIRKHHLWRKLGVNGPTPIPLFGNVLVQFYKTGHEVEMERYKKYGKIYGYFHNNTPILTIGDPEQLRNIMVKDWNTFSFRNPNVIRNSIISKMVTSLGGEEWKRVRSIVSPSFTSSKIKKLFTLIDDCVLGVSNNLKNYSKSKENIDLKKLFGAFSMDVISKVAFGTKTDAHNDPDDPFLKNATGFFTLKFSKMFFALILPRWFLNLINFTVFDDNIVNFFVSISRKLMKERREAPEKFNDFFQIMMNAEKSEKSIANDIKDINQSHFAVETNEEIERNANGLINYNTRKDERKLTENEIFAQSVLFFAAGYDTTASTLTNTIHSLTVNPSIQEKLYQEIKRHYHKFGSVDYDNLNELKYLHAVVSETLRFYPPLIATDRSAKEDYKLEGTDIIVPKKTLVRIPIYAIHHDPEYYPEPEVYKPERFLPENVDQIKPYTYIPFGAGPRNCIGMRLALTEAKLVLAKILLNYRFVQSAQTDKTLKFTKYNLMPLVHTHPVYVKVEERELD